MSKSRKKLAGVFPLIPLPVQKNEELDLEGMKENVKFLADAGVHGVIALGSMGESFQVSTEEFKKVTDAVVDAAGGKIATVIGSSWPNTREAVVRSKYAEDAGADGVMNMPPYYIQLTQDEAVEHYRILDNALGDLQVMVYQFQEASRINIEVETWEKLVNFDSIKAVKESSHDFIHFTRLLDKFRSRINVFTGWEIDYLAWSQHGAKGIVSLFGIGMPQLVLQYYNACNNRDIDAAVALQRNFVNAMYFGKLQMPWLKAMAELTGRKAGAPRSPYFRLPEKQYEMLRSWIKEQMEAPRIKPEMR